MAWYNNLLILMRSSSIYPFLRIMKSEIDKFYNAFARLDTECMATCYHDQVHFEDPAFGVLVGERARNMWRMLCQNQTESSFFVEHKSVEVTGNEGTAIWEAHYTFSQTGRKVHNIISAKFKFQDGKIIEHIDEFDLYRWSKQALGLPGYLIGWTPMFKKKLNSRTNGMLDQFEKEQPAL